MAVTQALLLFHYFLLGFTYLKRCNVAQLSALLVNGRKDV